MSKATRVVVDGVSYPLDDTTAVDFSEAQSLNAAEKQQARTNIGLGNVDDTSDANKPISTAQQTALNAKLDTANVYNGLDKSASGYALDARQGKMLADKLDATQSDIAIIIEGNQTTHTGGVAVGEYVIVCNSTISGITDGLYKAVQSIPANTAITSAYLAAVSGGGLNDVLSPKDVVNNLTSTATDKPGSANMLKTLNDKILNHQYMQTPTSAVDKINISGMNQSASYTTVKGWHRFVCDNGAYILINGIPIIGAPPRGRVACVIPLEAGVTIIAHTESYSDSLVIVKLLNGA